MRFLLSLAFVFALTLSASADVISPSLSFVMNGSLAVIPSELTVDGKGLFVISGDDGVVSVFDPAFDPVFSFTVPVTPDVMIRDRLRSRFITNVQRRVLSEVRLGEELTAEEAVAEARNRLEAEGVVWKEYVESPWPCFVVSYISDFVNDCYASLPAGVEIPPIVVNDNRPYEVYYVYGPGEKNYFAHEIWPYYISYENRFEFLGDWSSRDHVFSPSPMPFAYHTDRGTMSGSHGGSENMVVWTQTLFNNDDRFECLMPEYVSVLENDTVTQSIDEHFSVESVSGSLRISGFSVINDEGTTLASITIPDSYEVCESPKVFSLADNRYLSVVAGSDDGIYNFIYAIEKASGSVKSISAPVKVSVFPTVCQAGTPVNVSLNENLSHSADVKAVSMNGTLVTAKKINVGSSSTSLDTSAMSPGMYVIIVSDDASVSGSSKILVR